MILLRMLGTVSLRYFQKCTVPDTNTSSANPCVFRTFLRENLRKKSEGRKSFPLFVRFCVERFCFV